MKRKTALLFSLMAIGVSGCSSVKFNAKLYDNLGEQLKESFVNEHLINTSTASSSLPKQIIYPVTSAREYDAAFKSDYKINVNYEKELMLLCSFVSYYRNDHFIDSLDVADGILNITCDYKKGAPETGYVCAPYQRWCAITMSKVEYKEIAFVGEGR